MTLPRVPVRREQSRWSARRPKTGNTSTRSTPLGIVAGSAKVRLGGDSGTVVDLHVGDVVVIPAGVAHKGEAASPDLLIVGAYPGGRGPDMRIPGKGDREQALANIAAVPPPATDPVCGRSGPLIERWRTGVQR
jgi:uncharacterized protein YjlB